MSGRQRKLLAAWAICVGSAVWVAAHLSDYALNIIAGTLMIAFVLFFKGSKWIMRSGRTPSQEEG